MSRIRLRPEPVVRDMEYRHLGRSGLQVPVLSFGTGTFGGRGEFFGAWGSTDVAEAKHLIDICLDAGLSMFDSADVYSRGAAEEILGEAVKARRDKVLISTKGTFPMSDEPNDQGSSRYHLTRAIEGSLRRLQTDYIDLYQLHGFDASTPPEETLSVLDDFVRAGKIRYVGVSNYSGWHLMKSLATSERYNLPRYVAHQALYSLVTRDYEWELMPLAIDQGVGCVVWSPLGWGRLTGKLRRGAPASGDVTLARNGRRRPARGRRVSLSRRRRASTRLRRKPVRRSRRSRSTGCSSARPCRRSSSARVMKNNCARISAPSAGRSPKSK